MPHKPTIPMLPTALPQQRLSTVVEPPERPEGFTCHVGYGNFPAGILPRQGVPRSPKFLVQVEWAETPMNNGIAAFYLHGRKDRWLLWRRTLDDNVDPWAWRWLAVDYCWRRDIPEQTAAVHLLAEYWRFDSQDDGLLSDADPFDWINEVGLLDVADVRGIVRALRADSAAPASS